MYSGCVRGIMLYACGGSDEMRSLGGTEYVRIRVWNVATMLSAGD